MSTKIKIKSISTRSSQTHIKPISVKPSLGLVDNPAKFAQALTDDQLGEVLTALSDHYYNDVALVSDQVFDQLQDILKQRDPEHPVLSQVGASITGAALSPEVGKIINELKNKTGQKQITSLQDDLAANLSTVMHFGTGTSVTGVPNVAAVAGPNITNQLHRVKVKLPYWMGSMDKVKPGSSALGNWLAKFLGPYVLSDKMDGTSALLVIQANLSMQLFTRGDGEYGQDISFLLPYLRLPKIKSSDLGNKKMVVRGEFIMSKTNFKKFADSSPNPRNLVSGIVNSKTLKADLVKYVDFIAYELVYPDKLAASQQFSKLEKLGFTCASPTRQQALTEQWLVDYFTQRRQQSDYEIDGIIICEDQAHPRNTSGNPKYAVAFKMMVDEGSQVKETEVLKVEWKAQKDGYLFPVISIKPVFLSGITMSNCSGKTAKFIQDNCIGPGSKVQVTRDGEVIPGIYKVLTPSTTGLPSMPDPVETPYHWTGTETDIVLDNLDDNEDVQFKRILAFFKKMEVSGFSEGMITRCIENKLDTIPKIISATVQDFMKLPGVQIKSATKIHDGIKQAMTAPNIVTLMCASNSFGRGLGSKKLALLLQNIPDVMTWDTTKQANRPLYIAKICAIPGFEQKTADKFVTSLQSYKDFLGTLPKWVQDGVINPYLSPAPGKTSTGKISIKPKGTVASAGQPSATKPKQTRFANQKIVFTGVRNKDWEKIIELEGGQIMSSVSGNTTILVIKDHNFTSGKVTKAQGLGVKIMDMTEFQTNFKL